MVVWRMEIEKKVIERKFPIWGQIGVISGAYECHFRLKLGSFRECLHVISLFQAHIGATSE